MAKTTARSQTLEQASQSALEALEAGDLDAAAEALTARQQALDQGEMPTKRVFDLGVRIGERLRRMKHEIQLQHAQAAGIRSFTRTPRPDGVLDVRG